MIDDDLLPAATFLTSDGAWDVLAPVVAAAGGSLASCEPMHVQYRPACDLVVRYRAEVARADGTIERATLLAATTASGAPAGTVQVEAEVAGRLLSVGVWKWPFDPMLPALPDAVTPHLAEQLFAHFLTAPLQLDVVVYRPTERAVIRVTDAAGQCAYVKVVAPPEVAGLNERHRRMCLAGLPVPTVIASDETTGWVALAELEGPTMRDVVKGGIHASLENLPDPGQFATLRRRLHAVDPTGMTVGRSRIIDAPAHAAMLASILPQHAPRLERLAARFSEMAPRSIARSGPFVHRDLHEAQIIVDGTEIVGLLDIDESGPGDPVDDIATLIGHLRYRAATTLDRSDQLTLYTDLLRTVLIGDVAESEDRKVGVALGITESDVDAATAAVLIGLATGPFRVQMDGWQRVIADLLDLVDDLLDPPALACTTDVLADEKDLRTASSGHHVAVAS